jgi:hypothetical protein
MRCKISPLVVSLGFSCAFMRLREAMLNDDSALPSRNYLHFLDNEHDVFGRRFAPHCLYFLYATRAEWVEAYTILWVS